jgi:RHS repeat-associated protein
VHDSRSPTAWPGRWLRGLTLLVGVCAVSASAGRAEDRTLRKLADTLSAREGHDLPQALAEMERRDAARRREFAVAAARALPPRAAERLARARAAYEAGQGRLITILRARAAPRSAAAIRSERADAALAQEASAIVEKLLEASRREPLSAGELKVRPPRLTPPSLTPAAAEASAPVVAVVATAAPETPVGPVPQILREAAAALSGPVEVYEWVRNNIRPEFYHGVMKGSVETYLEQSGNDADTASVLVEMLRAKGIPARYVRGAAVLPEATLRAMTGTATAELGMRVLDRAGIPHDAPVLGGGAIASVRVERVWVEAYVPYANYRGAPLDAHGKLWIPLDPAFKRLASPRGLDVVRELGFDARATLDGYLAEPTNQTPLEYARGRVMGLLAQQRPDLAYADVLNDRGHIGENLGILPVTKPYAAVASEAGYGLPDSLRHTVHFLGDAAGSTVLDAILPVSDLLGRRLTLSYAPASEEDAEVARLYGGIVQTPPYLIEVRPVLKVGGVSVAAGTAGVGMGVRYTLRIELRTPGGTETVTNRILAGNLTAIGLGGRGIPTAEQPVGVAAQILSGLASSYLDRWNRADDELASLLHVVPVRPTVSQCMVMSDIEVDYAGGDPSYPLTFDWKGIAIDADLRASAPVGVQDAQGERHFLMLSGLEGSVLEHRAFEDEFQVDSVSTGKALQLATSQGVSVMDVTGANVESVLPGLLLDPSVKEEIREAVARGLLARVPASPVTRLAWTGVGYLLLDEETGEAAYQLQGGHSGGVTAPAVIDIPEGIVDPLIVQGEDVPTAPEDADVAHIQKFISTDLQEATVGTELAKALKVRVTDTEGQLVLGANVVFTVIGGEGGLRDPVDGTFKSELVVLSDDRGEASVTLRLGTNTGLIPRFTCLTERWDCTQEGRYLTQVGLNLVTARAGNMVLAEPFTGVGLPDDKYDGEFMYALLEATSTESESPWYNLSVADRPMVTARDGYKNPISNFTIRFAFRPPPVPDTPPAGTSRLSEPNDSPGRLLKPKDYEQCLTLTPSPAYGQCAGETEELFQRTSAIGAFAYVVIGDSAYSSYTFDIGTNLNPTRFGFTYHSSGFICLHPDPATCGRKPAPPVVLAGPRARLINRLGNIIEAYPLGDDAEAQFFAYALSEIEQLEKAVDDQGQSHYRAVRTNRWRREPLTNSEFRLTSQTPGTGVSPGVAVHVGGGTYAATMSMGSGPQLNTIGYAATHRALVIPYLQDRPDEVDPAYVTDNGIDPPTVTRVPGHPQEGPGDFSLWGVSVAVVDVAPFPIALDAGGAVVRPSRVQQQILPEEFRSLLAPLDVLFEVKQDDQSIVAATGLDDFEIPKGLAFPPGVHTAHVQVLRASRQDVAIAAVPFPLEACFLVGGVPDRVFLNLTRDPLNETLCGEEGQLPFLLCRPAKVTLKVDGVSVVENLQMAPGQRAILLPPALLGLNPNASAPFELTVVDQSDPTLQAVATGTVESSIVNRSSLPVGHTFVKGVDLLDGHLVQQATDFKVPGRHLGLEVTRTYSSAGRRPDGAMGAGWAWSYAAALHIGDCAVVVTTADGSSQAFSSTSGGNPFKPQAGYHTTLVKNGDNSYDFFDKSHTRHHFKAPLDPASPQPERERRLEYIEEPHGDRLVFSYDDDGRLARVTERHPEAGNVRDLELTYERKKGLDRITKAEIAALNLRAAYGYDEEGNLVSATRSGRNVDGPDAPDRVETYKYSSADARDRHQMIERTDPNSNVTAYEYYRGDDVFPGEAMGAGVFTALQKQEYVKLVRELPDGPTAPRKFETRFTYDFSEITQLRLKTTVKDARGNDARYVLNGNGSPLRIEEPFEEGTRATQMVWSPTDIVKTKEIDPLGRVTDYGYDPNGNLTFERISTDDFGVVETRYTYDETFNKLTLKKDAEGRETRYELDEATGDLLRITDAVGNRTQYDYDPAHGLLLTVTDPRGHITQHLNHDSYGNPRLIIDSLSNTTQREYDLRGRLQGQSDTLGHRTTTVHDGLDRPIEETRFATVSGDAVEPSDNAITRTEYYPAGQPRVVTNPSGASFTYYLDGLNRVSLTETQVEGGPYFMGTVRDGNGNKIRETDRRGVTRLFSYDKLNRLREVSIAGGSPGDGPYGRIAAYAYDLVGNQTAETDVAGNTTTFVYDGLYRVKRKILPETDAAGQPYEEVFTYDRVGNRLSLSDANEHTTLFAYDGLNRIRSTTNALSQVLRVEYDDPEPNSHVNKSLERDETQGLTTRYRYDELNREIERRVQFVNPLDSTDTEYLTTTSYADSVHSLTVTDPRGIQSLARLDGMDRVIEQVVDVGGLALSTQTSYDGLDNRKNLRDPNRNPATRWIHDGLGRQLRVEDSLGKTSRATYDGEGLRLTETDRRGITKTFSYDSLARARVIRVPPTIEGSKSWSHEVKYFDLERRREEYDARGSKTSFNLDRLGRLVKVTDVFGKTIETTYDGVGNKVSERDKRGFVTLFAYDPLNRLSLVRDPLDQTIETTYQDAQNRRVDKDKRGIRKLSQMDAVGRVVRVKRPYDPATGEGIALETHTYDGDNNRLSTTDAEGRVTAYEYERANRLRRRIDGQGSTVEAGTVFIYDLNGNKTVEIDPRSAPEEPSMQYGYDALNRLKSTTNGENEATVYGYDEEGNRTSVQEPKGPITQFDYDELGKLIRVTQPPPDPDQPSPVTAYGYDENRNRVKQMDANGNVVEMTYDRLDRLDIMIQKGAPEGDLVTDHGYDPNGNEVTLIDPKGQKVTNTYDELNRLKTKAYAFASGDAYRPWRHTTGVSYTYDGNNNLERADEAVASGTDPPATLTTLRSYDDLDRLASETAPLPDGGSRTVSFTYYRNGTRETITDPAGLVTRYTYDGRNRLESATTAFGTPAAAATTYTYHPDDLLRTVDYANGVVAAHVYDKADRLKSLAQTKGTATLSSYVYGYDPNGNRISQVETNGAAETTTYGYDGLNRLKTVTYPIDASFPLGRVVTYGYDPVGNRIKETEKGSAGALLADKRGVFDQLNRLSSLHDLLTPANSTTFAWDFNGNQISKTASGVTTLYRFDVRDRMVETLQGGSSLGRFQYDFEGRRNKKIGADGVRQYVYDQTSAFVEYDDTGAQVAKYDYGSDRLMSLLRRDEPRRFFGLDGLRSVTNLTDDGGAVAARYHLDAWGNFRFPGELTASKNRFAFTGYEWDSETGLFNAKARYFDPGLGRFLSQDSYLGELDEPPSLHRYFYANANPTRYVDPTGHFILESMLGKQLEKANLNLAGSFASTKAGEMLNFAGNAGLQFAAQGLQLPMKVAEGMAQLLAPNSRADGGFEGLARVNQAAALEQARDSNNPFLARVAAGTAAVLSQPAVVLEEGVLQPILDVPTKAEKVGVHIHQAMTSSNKVDAAVHLLEATKEGAEVFGTLGGLAATGQGLVRAAEGTGLGQVPFRRTTNEPLPSVAGGSQAADAAEIGTRARVLANTAESRRARQSSEFQIHAHRETAWRFYDAAGWTPTRIATHMRGIDFRSSVDIVTLPEGVELIQFQQPGAGVGNYFSAPGTRAETMGISPKGRVSTPYVSTRPVSTLRSIAATVMDTWSVKGEAHPAGGGGVQYFVPDTAAFVRK